MCKNTGPQGPEGGSGMRIVVKVGTSTLAHATGRLNIQRMERLCRVLSDLKNAGHEIILVSSGAIGMGVGKLNLPGRPADMPSKQAAAAVGQCELMYTYDKQFTEYSHTVAQLLLTGEDIKSEQRSRNVRNTLSRLLELGALPIINENDAVATDEIGVENTIGENDSLSAIVAAAIGADLLVLLSDIDGLYDKDPRRHPCPPDPHGGAGGRRAVHPGGGQQHRLGHRRHDHQAAGRRHRHGGGLRDGHRQRQQAGGAV